MFIFMFGGGEIFIDNFNIFSFNNFFALKGNIVRESRLPSNLIIHPSLESEFIDSSEDTLSLKINRQLESLDKF